MFVCVFLRRDKCVYLFNVSVLFFAVIPSFESAIKFIFSVAALLVAYVYVCTN